MKIIFLNLFFALMSFCSISNAQAILFIDQPSDWGVVLEKSKTVNKPIFVDVYTEWCGPCKWMDQNVFNQEEVGKYMNANFVNVKIDAEKGYGLQFAKEHKIGSYPTYLYFNPKGEIVLMAMASVPPEIFMKIGSNALKNNQNGISLNQILSRFQNELDEPENVEKYLKSLEQIGIASGNLLEVYLQLIPDDSLYTASTINLVKQYIRNPVTPDEKAMKVLMHSYKQKPIHDNLIGGDWLKIQSILWEYVDSLAAHKDHQSLDKLMQFIDENFYNEEMAVEGKIYHSAYYYARIGDREQFEQYLEKYALRYFTAMSEVDIHGFDKDGFNQYLMLKYGSNLQTKIGDSEWVAAKRRYINFPRHLFTNFRNLLSFYKNHFPESFHSRKNSDLKEWFNAAKEHYQNNQIFVVEALLDNYSKVLD